MKEVLYLSYDGMTDPLGQSQVLPYLVGLSKQGYRFTLISFEKPGRFKLHRQTIEKITSGAGIDWVPLSFTSHPPLVSKFYDAVRMRRKAFALHRKKQFDMVHCRSYIAADIGLALKKKFGIRFFFDMRGFWADEKRDGGAWKKDHPVFRHVYDYYKKKEKQYLQYADHIISLTHAGKKELMTWKAYDSDVPVSVIPCCADMDHFSLTSTEQKQAGRKILQLPDEELVISYLGSVGAWYMLDEMLELFRKILEVYPGSVFLFVTHSDRNIILTKLGKHSLDETQVKIIEAGRHEVPLFIKASDINISFIQPVYSKISSSPTKLGEVLAMGIPVIVNSGVGDVAEIVGKVGAGIAINDFSESEFQRAVDAIPGLLKKDPAEIRANSEPIYSLDEGITRYCQAYEEALDHVTK